MGFECLFHDGETQPEARAVITPLHGRLKQLFGIAIGQATAAILDLNRNGSPVPPCPHADLGPLVTELDGVSEYVLNCGAQPSAGRR